MVLNVQESTPMAPLHVCSSHFFVLLFNLLFVLWCAVICIGTFQTTTCLVPTTGSTSTSSSSSSSGHATTGGTTGIFLFFIYINNLLFYLLKEVPVPLDWILFLQCKVSGVVFKSMLVTQGWLLFFIFALFNFIDFNIELLQRWVELHLCNGQFHCLRTQ